MEQADKRRQWIAEAEAMRGKLADAGVAGRDELRQRSGMEFLQGIGSGALPPAPIAELLGLAVGCAIHTLLPAGKGYTTLELKVNYIRAMTDTTGPVRAEAKVVNLGSQVGIAEGRITDANGKLYAFATTTCLIFDI